MKSLCSTLFVALTMILGTGTANAAICAWYPSNGNSLKVVNAVTPAEFKLKAAQIGSSMGSIEVFQGTQLERVYCPSVTKFVLETKIITPAAPEDGFDKVYRTNVPGVGVRLYHPESGRRLPYIVPVTQGSLNIWGHGDIIIEFIRTGQDVREGVANLNFTIKYLWADWESTNINITGMVNLSSQSYFSGCSGTQKLDVPMGKAIIAQLERPTPRRFTLDVLCAGGPSSGAKLPVKVYFDGRNSGPGMLELNPGGAEGVAISLTTSHGLKLPFSASQALDLGWIRTETNGERFSVDVDAQYVPSGRGEIKPGKADAVLNYILEYN